MHGCVYGHHVLATPSTMLPHLSVPDHFQGIVSIYNLQWIQTNYKWTQTVIVILCLDSMCLCYHDI